MLREKIIESDVLVVGGGVAGCFAAVRARERGLNVTLVDMGYTGYTGATRWSLSGFIVYNPDWGIDLQQCIDFISKMGEYMNDREWTEIILKESWQIFQELMSWGADFRFEGPDGRPYVEDFLPVTVVRIGEMGLGPACRKRAEGLGVKILDRIMVTDLLKSDNEVVGAVGFSLYTGDFYIFKAKATVLATGGFGYGTGSGAVLAYKAGAEITCNGFNHTWPGAGSYPGGWPAISARSVFMRFVDGEGRKIDHPPNEELVDLKMVFLIHAGKGPIYWDLNSATPEDIERMRRRIKNTYPKFDTGFDPAQGGRILMDGHAVYDSGGAWLINKKCATSLPGLFAAGLSAYANILFRGAYHHAPGEGLTPSAVTGSRAGLGAAEYALQTEGADVDASVFREIKEDAYRPVNRKSGFDPRWTAQVVQSIMTPYFISLIKRGDRLEAALTLIEFIRDHIVPKLYARDWHELWLAHEVRNMVLNAEISLRASLFRTESRGTHYREDYPRRVDPDWLAWVKFKNDYGKMKIWKEPIPQKWWPDLSKPYEERYPRRFPGE
ncbi:MAG: FAD-binding protein [Candidatus Bathyarchaeia archaeon]